MDTDTPKKILIGAVILIASVLGLWIVWNFVGQPSSPVTDDILQMNVTDTDQKKGAKNGIVELVEYSDFQCPACKSFVPIINEVLDNNADTVTLIYRHFPLAQHKNAERAAQFAEAAGKQGKFFEMHDVLFERQGDWEELGNPDETFVTYAEELELDTDQLTTDADSDDIKAKVKEDLSGGIAANVNSTPSFFINGKKVRSPNSAESFQEIIDAELANFEAPPPDDAEESENEHEDDAMINDDTEEVQDEDSSENAE